MVFFIRKFDYQAYVFLQAEYAKKPSCKLNWYGISGDFGEMRQWRKRLTAFEYKYGHRF
jgi:hypothetical protein